VKEIQKYDGDGHLLASIGSAGPGLGQFRVAKVAAVDTQGNLYVTDVSNHCVQVSDIGGNFLRRFGSMGNGEGELRAPLGLAVAPDGSVYVADANDRVQKFRQE
jgi:tripartite motif-containing protein 71